VTRPLDEYLAFGVQVALEAGRVVMEHYQTALAVELKADASPVTLADRAAEQLIRRSIAARFPTHAVVGEEYGDDGRASTLRWIVDPIDGTKSFVRGVPLFGVLIALEIEGKVEVGVCHLPALRETVAAATGCGCTFNGTPARVSGITKLDQATVLCSDGRMLAQRLGPRWPSLESAAGLTRSWGDCYGHCLVATGRAEVMLDPVMNPWDCAALLPIVGEAGGRFTDWTGASRIDGGDAVSTNPALHDQVLALLRR
jgi:histidinol phosphatase-like enzyme (inositol monophosphatase family)